MMVGLACVEVVWREESQPTCVCVLVCSLPNNLNRLGRQNQIGNKGMPPSTYLLHPREPPPGPLLSHTSTKNTLTQVWSGAPSPLLALYPPRRRATSVPYIQRTMAPRRSVKKGAWAITMFQQRERTSQTCLVRLDALKLTLGGHYVSSAFKKVSPSQSVCKHISIPHAQ